MRNFNNIQVKNYKLQIPFISYKDLGQGRRICQLLPVLIWVRIIDIKQSILPIAY